MRGECERRRFFLADRAAMLAVLACSACYSLSSLAAFVFFWFALMFSIFAAMRAMACRERYCTGLGRCGAGSSSASTVTLSWLPVLACEQSSDLGQGRLGDHVNHVIWLGLGVTVSGKCNQLMRRTDIKNHIITIRPSVIQT